MIKAIIGLGNPGQKFSQTRHNIGFQILDFLASKYQTSFREVDEKEVAEIVIDNRSIILVKPLTFMNSSGRVIPYLLKKGIKPEEIFVVHDELDFPFGKLGFKMGGSARGHNGLKSIISVCGDNFLRFRFGIGRPDDKAQVPNYVLQRFSEPEKEIEALIFDSIDLIEDRLKQNS